MSHHASYTFGGLLSIGGIFAFAKKKSVPSLVAGVGLGALYFLSGYLIQQRQDHFTGHAIAALASAALVGAGASRYPKTAKKHIPLLLLGLGGVMLPYQANKTWQWRDDAPWRR